MRQHPRDLNWLGNHSSSEPLSIPAAFAALAVTGIQETEMESTVSTNGLKAKLDKKGITLVETLAPERYREAHLPGAINMPPERIAELTPKLLPDKNAEIITYCANTH